MVALDHGKGAPGLEHRLQLLEGSERLLQVFVSQPDPLRREARRGLLALRDGSLRPLYARALLTVPPDREPDLRVLIAELFPSGL